MAGAILQPLLIIKINTKRDYLIRRSSAAPPDAPVNLYKAIRATYRTLLSLRVSILIKGLKQIPAIYLRYFLDIERI
jgi:hypothetical protein